MKKKENAITRFVDQAFPFAMLLGFGYAGYTLNENGETLATIVLAISTFLWLLEHHAFTSQSENLDP